MATGQIVKPLFKDINELQNQCNKYNEVAKITSNDFTIASQLHGSVNIPHSYGNRLKYPIVLRTPNAAHIFAHIQTWDASKIVVGYYNTAGVSVTGSFDIICFLHN